MEGVGGDNINNTFFFVLKPFNKTMKFWFWWRKAGEAYIKSDFIFNMTKANEISLLSKKKL